MEEEPESKEEKGMRKALCTRSCKEGHVCLYATNLKTVKYVLGTEWEQQGQKGFQNFSNKD